MAGDCAGAVPDWGVDDCGWAGGRVIGADLAGAATGLENFSRMELPGPVLRSVRRTKAMAQIMNITAHQVVACERRVAAPRGPKAVWLPAPPNAPARSAALPLCSNTTMISTRQFITKKAVRSHPANRKPTRIIAIPINREMVHFIQPGIPCISNPHSLLEIALRRYMAHNRYSRTGQRLHGTTAVVPSHWRLPPNAAVARAGLKPGAYVIRASAAY